MRVNSLAPRFEPPAPARRCRLPLPPRVKAGVSVYRVHLAQPLAVMNVAQPPPFVMNVAQPPPAVEAM